MFFPTIFSPSSMYFKLSILFYSLSLETSLYEFLFLCAYLFDWNGFPM